MNIRLTNAEKDVLLEIKRRFNWSGSFKFKEYSTCVVFCENNFDVLDELRELCSDYLMEVGFDENDEPNKKGLLLESLVDKFFVG